jgi:chromosome segregation ATPase
MATMEELRELEATIEELRRSAEEIRREVGRREDAPYDEVDNAMLITEAEEQEAVIATLEERRRRLLQEVGKG